MVPGFEQAVARMTPDGGLELRVGIQSHGQGLETTLAQVANEVLGIIYTSKSGHSRLKWRQLTGPTGRVTGDASNNSLVNLSMARVISPEYVEELARRELEEEPHDTPPPPIDAPLEAGSPPHERPPTEGEPTFPPDEEEDDFDAADADPEEQDDLEEQEREETA